MSVHVYTRSHQPATWFVTVLDGRQNGRDTTRRRWTRFPGNHLLPTSCCRKRRPAKNLTVSVYYDHVPFWCKPGKGCNR